MERINHLVLVATLALCASAETLGQDTKPSPSPTPQERQESKNEDERVYKATEVDVKAKVKNKLKNLPELRSDCPEVATVTLRAILHKSGKVTEVVLIKGVGCSYDKQAIEAVRKFKFTPAVKDGLVVSQYADIEYNSRRY